MSAHRAAIDNITASFAEFESLIGSLTADQLTTQSLCPAWDVRGVALHVLGIENALIDWRPLDDDEMPPFEIIGPFMDDHGDAQPEQLAELCRGILDQRRANLAGVTDAELDQRCMSPVGQVPYGAFMAVRHFDVWVHHRDITTPLGIATNDGGPPAEAALDQIHNSLGYIVGKKIGLPDGMSAAFHVHGPVERTMRVVVDGRAAVVPEIEGIPSVEVAADTLTFIQLACGRIDPDEAAAAGRISWTGDEEWGSRAARNLAFTM